MSMVIRCVKDGYSTFIYKNPDSDSVFYTNGSQTPLALSNLFGEKAAEFAFLAAHCSTSKQLLAAVRHYMPRYLSGPKQSLPIYEVSIWQPKVLPLD